MKRNEDIILKVKAILLNEWDPIGVKAIPEAKDEYDDYAATLCRMIAEGKHESDFYEYLFWVESNRICLNVNIAHTQEVAKKIDALI